MDHPFVTRRPILARSRHCVDVLRDVKTLARASDADLELLTTRREPDMHDQGVRAAAERHASRLGCVLDDVADGCADVLKGEHETTIRALTPTWARLLKTGARLSDADVVAMDAAIDAFGRVCEAIEPYEDDGGSSSPSDYSDSSSHSRSGSGDSDDSDDTD